MLNSTQATVKLRAIMENEDGMKHLQKALSTYPLYKGKKDYDMIPTRDELNERLLNHYKNYEIGFETVGRFLDELRITMCEIMPYYNEMFKSVEIMADLDNPFDNVDVIEETVETKREKVEGGSSSTSSQEGTSNQNATSSQSGHASQTNNDTSTVTGKFSNTPQNGLNSLNDYLTELRQDNNVANSHGTTTDSSNSTSTAKSSDTSNGTTTAESVQDTESETRHTYTKKGNQGVNTYAHDMNEFRTSIIDVVNQIVTDKRIHELFLLVW